jgi:hypothetical protein
MSSAATTTTATSATSTTPAQINPEQAVSFAALILADEGIVITVRPREPKPLHANANSCRPTSSRPSSRPPASPRWNPSGASCLPTHSRERTFGISSLRSPLLAQGLEARRRALVRLMGLVVGMMGLFMTMGRRMIVMIVVMRGCLGCLTRVGGDVGENGIERIERRMRWSGGLGVLRPWLVPELMRRSFFQLFCFSIVTRD